jgi:outer membrane biogenesis lipoprotein LolB
MPRIALLAILAAALVAGCSTTRSAASGSTMATHDVKVQMDQDASIRTFQTDYRLRNGDRVQVLPDG